MKVYVVISECHDSGFDFGVEIRKIFSKRENAEKFCDNLNRDTEQYLEECEEFREMPGLTEWLRIIEFEVE